jgi:hypothetical protein
VAKTRQIQIDIEIKRKTRIPIDDVLVAHNELFKNTVGNLKAYRNKISIQDLFNEIKADWRAVAKDMRDQSDLANGQTAADRPPRAPVARWAGLVIPRRVLLYHVGRSTP